MKDIDFDELDRAVSSALGTTPTEVSEPPVAESPEPAPAAEPALVVPERSSMENTRPVQAPAARRSGRFMDVVHPSSDMRSGQSTPATPTPAVAPAAVTVPETPVATAESAPEASSPEQALESPFLPDAKVEKRPLGGPTQTTSLDDALAALNAEGSEEPAPVTQESPFEAPTPDVALPSTPAPETVPQEDVEAEAMGEEMSVEPEPAPQPQQAASIPQQYTESAPADTATQSGAIYDTESYHQPLAHPAKKSSGVMIIVWSLGLILLGGGLGVAAYFFLLPLL